VRSIPKRGIKDSNEAHAGFLQLLFHNRLVRIRVVRTDRYEALLNHKDGDVTAIYARWHMFEEKREAALAIEAALLPLMHAAPVAALAEG
jgi:hypothetical protein